MNVAAIPCHTAQVLGIADVPYPEGFTARFLAMDEDGVWYAHEGRPVYVSGEWHSNGGCYEIGIDDTDDLTDTPEVYRNLPPEQSLFEIVNSGQ